jgi:hypothetical protein
MDQQWGKSANSHSERGGQETESAKINKGEIMQTHILREEAKNLSEEESTGETEFRLTD